MQAIIDELWLQSLPLVIVAAGGINYRIIMPLRGQKVGKLSSGTKLGYPHMRMVQLLTLAGEVALADFKLVLDPRRGASSCRL